jgi:hypothetical protein
MSRLALFGRPWVVFDASNKDHRKWFAEFNKNSSWAHCPVRFVVDDDHGDLITMIQRHLIQYYVDREFVVKKQHDSREWQVVKKQQKRG